jgi:hypothetical protein
MSNRILELAGLLTEGQTKSAKDLNEEKNNKKEAVSKILSTHPNLNVIKDARKALAAAYDAGCAASKK